ncbi:quorum-sensing autoinducer synthase [Ramlibacter sp. G-1-2-2]|uniref:Quorum-sensing autoinducer synthase n=1 Tax=Ramlibacter agri TaxID=2728837 RepID=A0A848HCB2_9BURK|nr:alpha-hydroxyketone-type quorum-sensing autoinducer synthase [Ramlibacter agri]NML47752.1 quorum-sensing autoinducer synthase [Ramlibacter agri]
MEVLTRPTSGTPQTKVEPGLSAHLRRRIATTFQSRWENEWGKRFVTHGSEPGPNAVRLDGNDYLSVTGHAAIVQAQLDALRRNRDFIVQSGVFQLDGSPSSRFEGALADFVGKESALLCQSGYTANLGLIQVVADPETPCYVDSLAHMSLWEGVRSAGAPAVSFRHNDPEHLDRMIRRDGRPGLVIVDSVYSTTGALCPLERIVEVAERHGCMVLVDESHSLGTHGPEGRGLCAELGLTHRVHFITASLAKAFAGRAGFFTLPDELRPYLMCHSYPSIFSSCLLPHELAGLAATLEVVRASDAERARLRANTLRMRRALEDAGYPIAHGSEQIIGLEAGPEADTLALRDRMEERGVFGAVFCAPATSRNRSMLRLTLNASLTDAEMQHVESVARELAPVVKPWEWAIARRLK